jgi:predicted KAP-like P-loop ATPase
VPDSLLPELIDDRAVQSDDEDEFGHTDFVEELSSLVLGVTPPASVALFGAWGSGKSGISNLLRSRLKAEPGVKYAHFDAFKYAEAPLRRKFLSQIANEFRMTTSDSTAVSIATLGNLNLPSLQLT